MEVELGGFVDCAVQWLQSGMVFAINVLRNVASNWRCTSNMINTLSVDDCLISLQTDLCS